MFEVYFEFLCISITIYGIFRGLCTDIYLCFANKNSILEHSKKLTFFLRKCYVVPDFRDKYWKYGPFADYSVMTFIVGSYYDIRHYIPNIYTIVISLLAIHSIIFIINWMREKKEEKNNNPTLIPKEGKDIGLIHK